MFTIGERIQCVNSGKNEFADPPNIKNGNIYIVKKCAHKNFMWFVTIDGEQYEEDYFCSRFSSVKEQRKEKLNKIYEITQKFIQR